MSRFFIAIYDYLANHKIVMWMSMLVLIVLMGLASLQVKYVEDIYSFFPNNKEGREISDLVSNLKSKDRLMVMFTGEREEQKGELIEMAEELKKMLEGNEEFTRSAKITISTEDISIDEMSAFAYKHLPMFLGEEEYDKLDSIASREHIEKKIEDCYYNLTSPFGGYVSEHIYRDPLSIGSKTLSAYQRLAGHYEYDIYDGHIFLSNNKTLLCQIDIDPEAENMSKLIDIIEDQLALMNEANEEVLVDYFGGPAVAEYNARQIKRDSFVAINIAIVIVILVITIAFRSKRNILLLLLPVSFGALFALTLIYLIKGEISLIAVGSGSIIFGIALSYSIHMVCHTTHCSDVRELIADLVKPLTIGSFTTIGAFLGLMFTDSSLLQDLGLFSALTLTGTTVFSLIYLPHLLKFKNGNKTNLRMLSVLDRISALELDRNKLVVGGIIIVTIVSALFFNDVRFDSNMMNLNYNPPHLAEAEARLNELVKLDRNVVVVASASDVNEAIDSYNKLSATLGEMEERGEVVSYSDINHFIVPDSVQEARLEKWNRFWTKERIEATVEIVNNKARSLGFEDEAFAPFLEMLTRDYGKIDYSSKDNYPKLFADWITSNEDNTNITAHININKQEKEAIYEKLSQNENVIALDRSYFASKMAENVSDNFSLILYISSILIFIALFISYGRFELAILAFIPMLTSWIIIIGIMSLLGIEFNIVTIILSTFIFGIGDDFSIFVMDGMLDEYKERKKTLQHHKTAIIFSAFSLIVGMGVMIFAKHPAMNSLGILSFVGMTVVVLVSFTIQPFLFRLLITKYAHKGEFPYTIRGILLSMYSFVFFVVGCIKIQIVIIAIRMMPISSKKKKAYISRLVYCFVRVFMASIPTVRNTYLNEHGENFKDPSIIIANHQSFIDILLLLGLGKKMIMVTKGWVWNSPIFGSIVRYLDFFHIADGYEESVDKIKKKIDDGYSVIIFPEGSRSQDNNIKRFHKGAFFLAEQLRLDIIPVVVYGNGLVASKSQSFYIKRGTVLTKVLPRIKCTDTTFGESYSERCKGISKYFKAEYDKVYEEYNRASNNYFRDAIIANYIYKGPVLEWYMRVKLRMENYYDMYDRVLPRSGRIIDIGCGYGAMSYMLLMLSNRRVITGIDYDQEKIKTAENCFLKNENISFEHGDIRDYCIPKADAYIISDVLHYVDREEQDRIIEDCIQGLNAGGCLLIRDGDTSQGERHKKTEETERWSTKIIKFNKTDGALSFMSREQIGGIVKKNGMRMDVVECDDSTSNTLYIIRHNGK